MAEGKEDSRERERESVKAGDMAALCRDAAVERQRDKITHDVEKGLR